jgi:hypothetical protein
MPKFLFLVVAFCLTFMACDKDDDRPSGPATSILLSDPLPVNDYSVELNWTASNDSILSYSIYRALGDFETSVRHTLIASNLDKHTLSFIDNDVPYMPLVSYKVFGEMVDTKTNNGWFVTSNTVKHARPIPLVLFEADDMLHYPKRDVVFFIDREKGRMRAYNYKTLTETPIDFNAEVGFCSLNENNGTDELLVPRNDGWLFIYNAETLDLIEQIKVSAEALSSAFVNNHFIYCSTNDHNNSISVVDRNTSEASSVNGYSDQNLRLEKMPDSNTAFFGVKNNKVFFFNFDNEGNLLSKNESNAPWGGAFEVSSTFSLIPHSNSIISAPLGLIHDHTVTLQNSLPRGNFRFADFVVSSDGTKILAACSNQRSIVVYNLDDLTQVGSITTRGYPYRLFYREGALIVVSIDYVYDWTTTRKPMVFLIEEFTYNLE